jgi:hypothetical protein
MFVRILLPSLAANLPRAFISEWLVPVGDPAGFGEPICRVTVNDRVLIRGTRGASSLLARSRRTEPVAVVYEEESGRFEASYEILASEPVTIFRHVAAAGEALEIGALLGLAETGPGSPFDESATPLDSLPVMRVVARLVDAEADL